MKFRFHFYILLAALAVASCSTHHNDNTGLPAAAQAEQSQPLATPIPLASEAVLLTAPNGYRLADQNNLPDHAHIRYTSPSNVDPQNAVEVIDVDSYTLPPYLLSPPDEVISVFAKSLQQECEASSIDVIRDQYADMLFETRGQNCAGHPSLDAIVRVLRGTSIVAFIGYYAYVANLPTTNRNNVIAYLDSAHVGPTPKNYTPPPTNGSGF